MVNLNAFHRAARWLCAVIVLVIAEAAPRVQAAIKYTVTDLGSIGNPGDTTSPLDINNVGQVCGIGYFTPGFNYHGFRWTGGVMQDLGTLPGDTFSDGSGINDAGVVVGTSTPYGGAVNNGYRWTSGSMAQLGSLGGPYTYATAINNLGQVVGSTTAPGGGSEACLWNSGNGPPQLLGLLPGVTSGSSSCAAINDAGVIVGESASTSGTNHHAFRYIAGMMQDLGVLPGRSQSQARAINNSGLIVGHSGAATTERGFAWDGASMIALNTLVGDNSGLALGVNDNGEIVGNSQVVGSGQGRAVCWPNYNTPPVDLNTLIDPASGWTLTSACGINNVGQIVGTGNGPGGSEAYLLTPITAIPEPAGVMVMAISIAGLAQRRRSGAGSGGRG